MATAEFSKFAGILSAALSQHHLLGFEIAQLEFCHILVQNFVFVGALELGRRSQGDLCKRVTLTFEFQDVRLSMSDHTIVVIWFMKIFFV